MLDMVKEEQDPELAQVVLSDLQSLKQDLERYSFRMLMSGPNDQDGCFIEIRAGAGGTESCDWSSSVLRMYEKWGTDQGYEVSLVDEMRGDVAGIKNATLQVKGEYAYGWCKYETGVHRFVRMSKFSSDGVSSLEVVYSGDLPSFFF
jgi:peptide chain release factor 2